MPASWSEIIAGVAGALRTAVDPLNVVEYYSDSLNVPVGGVAEIGPNSGRNELNMERGDMLGSWVYSLTISLYLNTVVEDAAQKRMLAYMSMGSDLSVWTALEPPEGAMPTALAGIAEKVQMVRSHSYGNIIRESDKRRLITNSWDYLVWAVGE